MDKSVTRYTAIYYTENGISCSLLLDLCIICIMYFLHTGEIKNFISNLSRSSCSIRKNKESYLKISNATSFVCFLGEVLFISVVVSFPYNIENEIHLILQATRQIYSYIFFIFPQGHDYFED